MRYKGIVVGCGNIGALWESDQGRPQPRTHASALTANPRTTLAALVDVNQEHLKQASALFPNVPTYTDLTTCLTEIQPHIAIIATNSATHASIIEHCAESSVSMIIGEKPIAHSVEDAERIRDIIAKNNTTFVLNYQRRLFPLFNEVREKILHGAFGKIQQITCYYSNGARNNAGHIIDALMFLLNEKIVAVHGRINERNTTHPEHDLNIDGLLITESNITIMVQSFDQKYFGINEIYITGEKNVVLLREYGYALNIIPLKFAPTVGMPRFSYADSENTYDVRSMTNDALAEAVSAYEEKRVPMTSIKNGMETLAVLEALSTSALEDGVRKAVEYTA